ncbi:MAG: DUF6502 family protein [Gammaproteobacteria bacterium]
MEANKKSLAHRTCRLLLRPIILLLLKCGVTWREFSEVAKLVYVEVATAEFGIRGRPTNVSRASILTGLSRKEITRQRARLAASVLPEPDKTNDATRLLSGWNQDPDFRDRDGQPLPLPERGPSPSFESLFGRYGGDSPFQTLLKELKAAGSVGLGDDGRLVARRRYHMPAQMSDENIRLFGTNLFDHARTLERNIAGRKEQRRFEGYATEDRIRASAVGEFHRLVNERGQRFLEEIDAWLHQHRVKDQEPGTLPIRLGVGLYSIDGQLPEGR